VPLVGEVDPLAGADGLLDLVARLERQQGGVADQKGGVGLLQHRDRVGGMLDEAGLCPDEFAEENFSVGERTARSRVGGDGADGFEDVRFVLAS